MNKLFKFSLLVLLSISTCTYAQTSTAKWQAQAIIIDGQSSDWGMLPRFFNSESNIKYEFRNDDKNLYFILKAGDRAVQMQLLQAGLNIRFKLKTSVPMKTEIKFVPIKRAELNQTSNGQEVGSQRLIEKSVSQPNIVLKDSAMLDGFQFTNGLLTSDKRDENSIYFARSSSSSDLATYEICIPLREFFGDNYKLENITTIAVQLQVNINALSMNDIKRMHSKMGGVMHGGRGMGGGREGEMGRGGMSRGEMSNEMSGQEMGEMNGSEGGIGGVASMESISFNKDFMLSNVK
jgi:hypothetical protein